ncbi:COMM domain-containing protein 7-like [Limulus polyphemus]|uniref:COMM domain-containing protein 7-like n=1 Tax=Limulus polyphemus TaxID=6850 RepID=A0ABM1BQ45_LIMPO|nr:COMM domain-containing protein 7-like [Limulus polyphemus]
MAVTGFYFSENVPPDAVISDFQTMNKLNFEQFSQLVEIVFQFLAGKHNSTELLQHLGTFSEKHGVNLSGLRNIMKSLLLVPQGGLKRGITAAQMRADAVKLGLSEDKAEHLSKKWESDYSALVQTSLNQIISVNQLIDMEWKFGVTAASSEINQVGNTFLQMKLVIDKGNGQVENKFLELSLAQFYSFLHEMERAKTSLEFLV